MIRWKQDSCSSPVKSQNLCLKKKNPCIINFLFHGLEYWRQWSPFFFIWALPEERKLGYVNTFIEPRSIWASLFREWWKVSEGLGRTYLSNSWADQTSSDAMRFSSMGLRGGTNLFDLLFDDSFEELEDPTPLLAPFLSLEWTILLAFLAIFLASLEWFYFVSRAFSSFSSVTRGTRAFSLALGGTWADGATGGTTTCS